jgi:hypothetical protein
MSIIPLIFAIGTSSALCVCQGFFHFLFQLSNLYINAIKIFIKNVFDFLTFKN